MSPSSLDPRLLATDLAKIERDLERDHPTDELFAIAKRLSEIAAQIASAYERAFVDATQEIAA